MIPLTKLAPRTGLPTRPWRSRLSTRLAPFTTQLAAARSPGDQIPPENEGCVAIHPSIPSSMTWHGVFRGVCDCGVRVQEVISPWGVQLQLSLCSNQSVRA